MPQTEGHSISWDVVTHVHKERTNDWYWALGLVAFAGAALSLWLGDILFSIIIILGAGSLGVLAARGPREHGVHISDKGIAIDGTLYNYRSIKSFWVDKNPERPRLYLMTQGIVAPHITLPLENVAQADQVRSYLRPKLEEVEQEPHFGEHFLELIGL
ncbi:MAG TPA: hypothetical protein VMR46_02050 [Candidatus Paceibacterota bacterium]|nr:hypothetical protein [Candidatus Paceibacterota bacterium]